MKKFILINLFVLLFAVSSFSQTYDMILAREAYSALLTDIPNHETEFELILVQGISIENLGLDIDFTQGTANIWSFTYKSKQITDTTLYIYVLYSIDGVFYYEMQESEEGNAQNVLSITSEWKDSDLFSSQVVKNVNLMKFISDNDGNIGQKMFMLIANPEINADVWIAAAVTVDQNVAMCSYNAVTLELIECEIASSVNEILAGNTKLYPNPAGDYINIELPFNGNVKLDLYNSNGVIIKSENLFSDGNIIYNTSGITGGLYNIVIKGDNFTFNKKIVIVR